MQLTLLSRGDDPINYLDVGGALTCSSTWLPIMATSAREVLQLYRAILRRGQALRYTDRDYFRRTVSEEFKRWKDERDPKEVEFHIRVSRVLKPRSQATPLPRGVAWERG